MENRENMETHANSVLKLAPYALISILIGFFIEYYAGCSILFLHPMGEYIPFILIIAGIAAYSIVSWKFPGKKDVCAAIFGPVVIGALFFIFIGMAGFYGCAPNKQYQSDAYWQADASPFAILDHSQSGKYLTLTLENTEGLPTYRLLANNKVTLALEEISVAGHIFVGKINPSQDDTSGKFKPEPEMGIFRTEEKKSFSIEMSKPCNPGDKYEYYVNISSNSTSGKEFGIKSIVGKCG